MLLYAWDGNVHAADTCLSKATELLAVRLTVQNVCSIHFRALPANSARLCKPMMAQDCGRCVRGQLIGMPPSGAITSTTV
jgi:hypothetical protein